MGQRDECVLGPSYGPKCGILTKKSWPKETISCLSNQKRKKLTEKLKAGNELMLKVRSEIVKWQL